MKVLTHYDLSLECRRYCPTRQFLTGYPSFSSSPKGMCPHRVNFVSNWCGRAAILPIPGQMVQEGRLTALADSGPPRRAVPYRQHFPCNPAVSTFVNFVYKVLYVLFLWFSGCVWHARSSEYRRRRYASRGDSSGQSARSVSPRPGDAAISPIPPPLCGPAALASEHSAATNEAGILLMLKGIEICAAIRRPEKVVGRPGTIPLGQSSFEANWRFTGRSNRAENERARRDGRGPGWAGDIGVGSGRDRGPEEQSGNVDCIEELRAVVRYEPGFRRGCRSGRAVWEFYGSPAGQKNAPIATMRPAGQGARAAGVCSPNAMLRSVRG